MGANQSHVWADGVEIDRNAARFDIILSLCYPKILIPTLGASFFPHHLRFDVNYLIATGIGLTAGVASGFFGIGGGIIIIPALIFFLGMTMTQAAATSLAAMLLPVGILCVMNYWKAGQLPMQNIYIALILAAGLMFGALFGSKIALQFDQDTLRKAFAVLLVFVAIRLVVK